MFFHILGESYSERCCSPLRPRQERGFRRSHSTLLARREPEPKEAPAPGAARFHLAAPRQLQGFASYLPRDTGSHADGKAVSEPPGVFRRQCVTAARGRGAALLNALGMPAQGRRAPGRSPPRRISRTCSRVAPVQESGLRVFAGASSLGRRGERRAVALGTSRGRGARRWGARLDT